MLHLSKSQIRIFVQLKVSRRTTRGHLSQIDELYPSRISLMVFYLSVTKKPQLAEIGPRNFLSAPFWLKSAYFLPVARRCHLTDAFGHKAKSGQRIKSKYI